MDHTDCEQTQTIETGFLDRTVTIDQVTYAYQVYVPREYTPQQSWPVILFLHGAGERGDDGLFQTEVGIGSAIRRHRDRFPCIVVMPQCRLEVGWSGDMERQALQALDQTMETFNCDPQRVCLTGLSMGGHGTWYMAARHPGKFAAIVPICGWIYMPRDDMPPELKDRWLTQNPFARQPDPFAAAAEQIGITPVWIFHGDADQAVSVDESRRMFEALRSAGGDVRYSEYMDIGHNSWDNAYAEKGLMPWLLTQKTQS